jgi:ABC-type spermidine/putrescine transport system permease subunit II
MITTTTACLLALLLFPLLLLLWATESKGQRIRRWRRSGLTWRACAERLGVSQSTARRWAMA